MSKIISMGELRDRVLKAFVELENDEIEIEKAMALSKMSETVISGLKSEMLYATLTNQQPYIPFYNSNTGGVTIEAKPLKKLK